jgi:hypothetical protein
VDPLAVDSALTNLTTQVLACGIVGTIGLGLIKLSYDKHKLRKYSKVDKGRQAQSSEMLEAQPVTQVMDESKDEIPFGIRAIQSGVEIDGVWISRSNTSVGSSRASIMTERLPRSFKVFAERTHHHVSRNPAAPNALESPRSTQTSIPPFRELYHTFCLNYADFTIACDTQQYQTGQSSKQSRLRTSDESDYLAITHDVRAYETAYFRPSSTQAPIDPRTDLELLRSHRLSHVAETGQLTPRVRKPCNSGEWARLAENQVALVNGVNCFMTQNPSKKVGVTSSVEPSHDGNAANQTRQAMPLTESYAPSALY